MQYLTESNEIREHIVKFASAKTLWLDTETANWHTNCPHISLIQVLLDPTDLLNNSVYLLDVLNKPKLVADFIAQVMNNPKIEKIFYNASYDLKFLGKQTSQNVTCTLKLAKKIGVEELGVTNLKLKTLAAELCHFSDVDTDEQGSDWGKRSLTEKQLQYAAMDVVYLAAVHRHLLEITSLKNIDKSLNMPPDDQNQLIKSSLTPTKVRIALECSRLFYLNHKLGGKSLFVPTGVTLNLSIGNVFHKLADDFIKLVSQEQQFKKLFYTEPSSLKLEEISSQVQQRFYELKFFPYLQEAVQRDASQATALLQVWQGLQGLIRNFSSLLISNRNYCSAEEVIRKTFRTEERKVEHYFTLPDGTQQRVAGKFDCLIYNYERERLCVVEFKTYEPADPSAQLAQVALYSYMLWVNKKVPVDSAVYCVLPEFKDYQYSWEELENTVHQLIPYKLQQMQQWLMWEPPNPDPPPPTTQPHLCTICPQQETCQNFFTAENNQTKPESNPSVQVPQAPTVVRPTQEPKPKQSFPEPFFQPQAADDAMGEELVSTLQSFGVDVDYQGAVAGPAFVRVKLKPQLGVKVSSILKLSDDLQVQLGLTYPPLITPQAGYVSVDLPRPDRQIAYFEQYIQPQTSSQNASVQVAIGINLDGKLIEADLSDPNTCHFLVGGTTGSGKSEFLRSLLLSLLTRHSPQHLKIALVDPKRVTFPEFEQMPWLYSPVVKDSDRAIELMDELVTEMEKRYQCFESYGCADLNAYNQQVGNSKLLPRIVCIFDEYADFMAEKETRIALEQNIKRLGAMARAAGIHLIIATQRPEAKVVTPLIRSNLPGRVALRTASEADSTIVLGSKQTAAANLLGKGDLLYQVGAHLYRLQSLFTTSIQLPKSS